jgi:hypothetical protein
MSSLTAQVLQPLGRTEQLLMVGSVRGSVVLDGRMEPEQTNSTPAHVPHPLCRVEQLRKIDLL